MHKPLIAVDICLMLDLAASFEETCSSVGKIRSHSSQPQLIVTRTVIGVLSQIAETATEEVDRALADLALTHTINYFSMKAFNTLPVGAGISEEFAKRLERDKLIPTGATSTSETLIEAALLQCDFLMTTDRLLLEADFNRVSAVLHSCDIGNPCIGNPDSVLEMLHLSKKQKR